MRKQVVDLRGRMDVDAEQDVAQIRERVDVVQVARRNQRVQPGEVVTALGIANEQEILPVMPSFA